MATPQFWKPGQPKPGGQAAVPPSTKSPAAKAGGNYQSAASTSVKKAASSAVSPKGETNLSKETMRMKFMMRGDKEKDKRNSSQRSRANGDGDGDGDGDDAAPPPPANDGQVIGASAHGTAAEKKAGNSDKAAAGGGAAKKAPGFKWRLAVALPATAAAAAAAAVAKGGGGQGSGQHQGGGGGCLVRCEAAGVDPKSHVLSRRSFGGFNKAVELAYEEMRDDPLSKGAKRLERHAVSDIEMANFYKNRVGPEKKDQRGGGKGGGKGRGNKRSISGAGASSSSQHDFPSSGDSTKRKRR